jgi:hypothetical protein
LKKRDVLLDIPRVGGNATRLKTKRKEWRVKKEYKIKNYKTRFIGTNICMEKNFYDFY